MDLVLDCPRLESREDCGSYAGAANGRDDVHALDLARTVCEATKCAASDWVPLGVCNDEHSDVWPGRFGSGRFGTFTSVGFGDLTPPSLP
jgi:hypothetical protein